MNLVLEIAWTHVSSRVRQTLVGMAGVAMGVGFSIMMASLMEGSQRDFVTQLVDSLPHVQISDERRTSPPQPAEAVYPALKVTGLSTPVIRPGIKNPYAILATLEGWIPGAVAPSVETRAIIRYAGRDTAASVIGVHLRRGDRAPGGVSFAPFSTLPPAYFREAEARFSGERNFLVFSDTPEDIAWCRDHLGLGEDANVTFGEGRDPILDMFALVKCDHVILSAGTFSWWAGYLGERPGRRVIVPNALQGMSAEWASLAVRPRPAGWEEVTLAPGSAG